MRAFYDLKDSDKTMFLGTFRDKNNFLYDFFNIYTFHRLKSISKHGQPLYAGLDFLQIKSGLIKKYQLKDKDDYISLDQLSRMNLKERLEYKNHQLEVNSLNNLYQSIDGYLVEKGVDRSDRMRVYNETILNEVNEAVVNHILNNKEIYTGLVIVRKERLDSIYDKINEYVKLI
jgi:hypothetical protein